MSQVADSRMQTNAPPATGKAHILVVDDEQYMCDVCMRTLRRSGYKVFATTEAKKALEVLRQDQTFDLLLTDIRMPIISGLELARLAREIAPSIAIIIMTGHASLDTLIQVVRRGAVEFLTKPFELEQLRLAVEQALHHRHLLQDSLRLRTIERLLQSSEAINTSLDRDQLIKIVLRTAYEYTDCQAGFLLLHDGHQFSEAYGISTENTVQPEGHALVKLVYQTGQATLLTSSTPICISNATPMYRGLATPLRAHNEVLGVLLVCDDRPEMLRSVVQESVTLLANQAGIALHNAALYGALHTSNQRLQELDRLKGEFISIASHELRTPLAIVLGYTMMVRDQLQNEQYEYLQRVLDNAQRMKDIVDDMISLQHLETGELQMQLQPHQLQALVSQAVEQMLPVATGKQQLLSAFLPAEPVTFLVDSEKYLLILGHLISNAIKFTPKGQPIEIHGDVWHADAESRSSASLIDFSSASMNVPACIEHDSWVIIQVSDRGIGIPEREQARIFERFYQVADSLTREQGGTGLGLAIVRELVKLQHGVVWVTSVEMQGSTFSVAIPYHVPGDPSESDGRS